MAKKKRNGTHFFLRKDVHLLNNPYKNTANRKDWSSKNTGFPVM
jgi:hypothetical protein